MNSKFKLFGALCALALSSLACQQDCYRAGDQEAMISGKLFVVQPEGAEKLALEKIFVFHPDKPCSVCKTESGQGPAKNVSEIQLQFSVKMDEKLRQSLLGANGLELRVKGWFQYPVNAKVFKRIIFVVTSILEVNGQSVVPSN